MQHNATQQLCKVKISSALSAAATPKGLLPIGVARKQLTGHTLKPEVTHSPCISILAPWQVVLSPQLLSHLRRVAAPTKTLSSDPSQGFAPILPQGGVLGLIEPPPIDLPALLTDM